jgi:hypothetical protein
MTVVALRTNVHEWESAFCTWLDRTLEAHGVALVDLPWCDFALYRDDRDHFTWKGFTAFCTSLARALASLGVGELCIYADSTIDFHNWRGDTWSGRANAHLLRVLARVGVRAHIAAINGSGFVACAQRGGEFAARAASRAAACDVLFVGGWNDRHFSRPRVERAVQRAVAAARGGS